MEKYLIYQVRINLLQQNLVTLDDDNEEEEEQKKEEQKKEEQKKEEQKEEQKEEKKKTRRQEQSTRIMEDIITLYQEVIETKNDVLITEFLPQIENLCVILNEKVPFM